MHEGIINGAALLDGGSALVTVGDDKTARLWSAATLEPLGVLRPPVGPADEGALYAVAASVDRIAVGGRTGAGGNYAIDLFARQGLKPQGNIAGLPQPITALAFNAGGTMLAAGMQEGGGMRAFDLKTQTAMPGDDTIPGTVHGLAFDDSGRLAVTADDAKLRLYTQDMRLQAAIALPPGAAPWSVAFSPDGKFAVVGDRQRAVVYLVDTISLRMKQILEGQGGRSGSFTAVAVTPDGSAVLAAGSYRDPGGQHFVRVWGVTEPAAFEAEAARDLVTAILPLRDGLLFTSADPMIGRLGMGGGLTAARRAAQMDFRDAGLKGFQLSSDGSRIQLPGGAVFDLAARSLSPNGDITGFARPDPSAPGIIATDWRNSRAPKINGRAVPLEPAETARAASASQAAGGVAIGTDFYLRFEGLAGERWRRVTASPAWAVNVSADGSRVVAGLGDGSLHWYDTASGDELAALFVAPGSRHFVVWTPQGFFDHDHPDPALAKGDTTDGRGLIGYTLNAPDRRSAEFIQIGQLYPSFFRPDLVGLSFRNSAPARAELAAQRARIGAVAQVLANGLPPAVSLTDVCGHDSASRASDCPAPQARLADQIRNDGVIETSAEEVLVDYRVAPAPGGKFGAVTIRRNQAVIKPRLFAMEEDPKFRRYEAAVPVGMGENTITLSPVTEDGQVEASADRSVALKIVRVAAAQPGPERTAAMPLQPPQADAKPEARGATLYLLSAGVSQFQQKALNLANADADAASVAKMFAGSNMPVYARAEITTLLNGEATSEAIEAALRTIAAKARPDDLVVLFLAGHGQQVDGHYYYAPVEFGTADPALFQRALGNAPGADQALDDLFRREGLGQDKLLPIVQSIQAARVAVVLDTCFSASIATQDAVLRRDSNATVTQTLGHASGRFVLSSATALALDGAAGAGALPSDKQGHGLFTSFLLRGLQGEADSDHSGRVDIYKLAVFTKRHVEQATAAMPQVQEPAYFFTGSDFFDLRAVAEKP